MYLVVMVTDIVQDIVKMEKATIVLEKPDSNKTALLMYNVVSSSTTCILNQYCQSPNNIY